MRILWLDPECSALPGSVGDVATDIVRVLSVQAALSAMRGEAVQLVVSEVLLPGLSGFELARRLSARDDAPPVLIRSRLPGDRFLPRAIRAGARGFIQAAAEPEVLAQAIRWVLEGKAFWDAPGTSSVARLGPQDAAAQVIEQRIDGLTPRLFEALHLMLQGMDSAAMAAAMHVTRRSAAGYRRELHRTFGMEPGVEPDSDLSPVAAGIDAPFYAAARMSVGAAGRRVED